MVSVLEKELTNKQVKWLTDHPEHKETKKLIVWARVADWGRYDAGLHKGDDTFRDACSSFRKWWISKDE